MPAKSWKAMSSDTFPSLKACFMGSPGEMTQVSRDLFVLQATQN